MTPEQQIAVLKSRIEDLERIVASMQSPNTVSPEFQNVLDRYGLSVSSKDVNSEDQAVNEAGSNVYNVLKEPDGFAQATLGGAVRYFPYYN